MQGTCRVPVLNRNITEYKRVQASKLLGILIVSKPSVIAYIKESDPAGFSTVGVVQYVGKEGTRKNYILLSASEGKGAGVHVEKLMR